MPKAASSGLSVLLKKIKIVAPSGKGSGNAATFPAVARMLLRGRKFRGLSRWTWYALFYLILINKLPSLSLPLGNAKGSPAESDRLFIIAESFKKIWQIQKLLVILQP